MFFELRLDLIGAPVEVESDIIAENAFDLFGERFEFLLLSSSNESTFS